MPDVLPSHGPPLCGSGQGRGARAVPRGHAGCWAAVSGTQHLPAKMAPMARAWQRRFCRGGRSSLLRALALNGKRSWLRAACPRRRRRLSGIQGRRLTAYHGGASVPAGQEPDVEAEEKVREVDEGASQVHRMHPGQLGVEGDGERHLDRRGGGALQARSIACRAGEVRGGWAELRGKTVAGAEQSEAAWESQTAGGVCKAECPAPQLPSTPKARLTKKAV